MSNISDLVKLMQQRNKSWQVLISDQGLEVFDGFAGSQWSGHHYLPLDGGDPEQTAGRALRFFQDRPRPNSPNA